MSGLTCESSVGQDVNNDIHKTDSIIKTTSLSHHRKQYSSKKGAKETSSRMENHESSCNRKRGKKRKLLEDVADSSMLKRFSEFGSEKSNSASLKRPDEESERWEVDSGFCSENSPQASGRSSPIVGTEHCRLVALDCEMVGTGPGGQCSEVARCSIIDYDGGVIYDEYILPQNPVTDYRTRWSGIRKHHLTNAVPFEKAQIEIINILRGKIVVGHALFNDFQVLDISVLPHMIRDTMFCKQLKQRYNQSHKSSLSLKKLSLRLLHRLIQVGNNGHCSIEDARAALDLYKLVEDQWEKDFLTLESSTDDCSSHNSLEHYMQDQYWLESMMDCSL